MNVHGGFRSIAYVLKKSWTSGGFRAMWKAMRTPNACKTCALGMGGQRGGMVNESGKFPEFCKKSVQAMSADMQGAITPEFFEQYSIAQLSAMSPRELEACGRLTFPVYAGPLDVHYTPISWDDSLTKVSSHIKNTDPHRAFYYCSGRSSNEAGFLLQLAARVHGTNNVNNCSYFCHQASSVGLKSVVGSGTATVDLEDISACDFIFLIGCNPASNHPRLLKSLVELRRRGGKVVVINPLREEGLCKFKVPSDMRSLFFGSTISDYYLQPNIGGDAVLMLGLIKWLVENDGINDEFVNTYADGFDEVSAQASETSWEWIVQQCGVKLKEIEHVAGMYKASSSAIFCWAMGVTHVKGGVDGVRMIANVAIARGMVGKKGAGLLPLRGHSNVQGMGTIGVVPKLNQEMEAAIEKTLGITLPTTNDATNFRGGDTMVCMEASINREIDYAMCLGGNLLGANPDTKFAMKAFSAIKLVSYMSTTLNQGHFLGRGMETIIFPVRVRDEESQITTQESMFSYVRRSEGGAERHQGPRSEVEVIVDIASDGIGVIDWEQFKDHDTIRQLIASCVSGFDPDREHTLPGRHFHSTTFHTDTTKIKAHTVSLHTPTSLEENQLRLMTIRSEGQFNTVVYEEEDIYRRQKRRDIIMMSKEDATQMNLEQNEMVRVKGSAGELHVVVRHMDIANGNCAMYYPEANVLLSREVDVESRTPIFKGAVIHVEKT
jgi:molybdopterin-dependent oxidoreductase alpha subunit